MAHTKASTVEVDRIISLAGGSLAYVCGDDGSSQHLRTNTPEFVDAVAVLVSQGHGKRIRAQIDSLANNTRSNWPKVQKSLEAAGVFA
jgi:hypothetical protein